MAQRQRVGLIIRRSKVRVFLPQPNFMPDSKRQKIVAKAIEMMQNISIANDYRTDLGTTVEDWRVNWQEDDLPALSVCDTVAEETLVGDQPTAEKEIQRMNLQFRIFTAEDERAENLRKMIADVKKALKKNLRFSDGTKNLALWTKPLRSGIVVPTDSFEIGGALVEVEIAFMTDSFDEY